MRDGVSCFAVAVVAALLLCQPATAFDNLSLCERDYPIPLVPTNYAQLFASETLAPNVLTVNGKLLNSGAPEKVIETVLGTNPTVSEDWQSRSDQQQCEYLLGILRENPNSMHLYKLADLKSKKMAGLFRASEWQLQGIGTLRAFFHKSSATGAEASYLYHVTLLRTAPAQIHRKKGGGYVLVREGPPKIEWDVQRNRISIWSAVEH